MTATPDPTEGHADPRRSIAADPLGAVPRPVRHPDPELVYLDGNSLGRPPRDDRAAGRVAR